MPVEVSPETWEADVVRASHEVPILVDFWAPWCGPCRTLSPLLEEMEAQADGRWRLATANVEAHPELGQRHAVSSIPALKLFVDGAVVTETVGALGRLALQQWLDPFLPGEEREALAAGRAAESAGDDETAGREFRRALEAKPLMSEAKAGLARVLLRGGEVDAARELVDEEEGAEAAKVRIDCAASGGPSVAEARERVAAEARDRASIEEARGRASTEEVRDRASTEAGADALLTLGLAEASAGDHEAALEALLEAVRLDPSLRDGAARRAMLDVFTVLGADSELAADYRRRLAMLLY